MRSGLKTLSGFAFTMAVIFGIYLLLTPTSTFAKGKPKPPPCDCPETIELPNGTVCTLEACGFDCVYVCPFPG